MSQSGLAVVFVLSILLVGVGSFYAGIRLTYVGDVELNSVAQSILSEAKSRVPEPVLPPKPPGQTITEIIDVPRTIPLDIKGGFFGKAFRDLTIVEKQQKTRFVDAGPQAIANWETNVAELQAEYNRKLQAEVQVVSDEQTVEILKRKAEILKGLVLEALLPLIAALAGLVGAIVTLTKAFKSSPPAKNEEG